ncbi:MAG: T9SS type A sorting domain-containing protein [Bacteroidota bacterium]|nr:T9SS type A sorting domain-containing protein [Bacteroidota bacterium]
MAVRADGTLWACGSNILGQMGAGTSVAYGDRLLQIGTDSDWASVSAGMYYTLALKTNGTLWAWGNSINLGFVSPSGGNTYLPQQVGSATNWVRICAGKFSLGLQSNGTLWGWGENRNRLLFNTTDSSLDTPTQLGTGITWSRIAGGDAHILATKADGTLWGWGFNLEGMVGNGTQVDAVAPVQLGAATTWRRVAAGGFSSAADQTDGSLWIWGDSKDGQTGDPALTVGRFATPVQVGTATTWAVPAANPTTGLGIRTDGGLWTWGDDFYADLLGDGPREYRQTVARIDSLAAYIRLSGNDMHTLALRADSSLWAWGDNQFGELGDGTTTSQTAPVAVARGPWKQLATSQNGSLAVRADGTLWAWGNNSYGQLGDGTTVRRTRPVQVGSDRDWAQVVCSQSATFALRTDGSLWAWGRPGTFGNGSSSSSNQLTPLRIGTVTTWVKLAASQNHILALRTDGSLWGWGSSFGQAGDTQNNYHATPLRIGTATDWTAITASQYGSYSNFSLAQKSNGTLWSWGNNSHGQLGYATALPYSALPAQIGSVTWTELVAGGVHVLGVQTNGTLWEWGDNRHGQAGMPSRNLRPSRVQTGMWPVAPFSLTSFSPGAGVIGSSVTFIGVGLSATQLVTIGGVVASGFSVNPAGTALTVAVPAGARTGPVALLGSDGTVWGPMAFQVLLPPTISSFTPMAASPGTTITVTGTNLTGTTALQLGGVGITGFVVNPAGTSLTFSVPATSTGGFITVTTNIGTSTSTVPLSIVLAVADANGSASFIIAPQPAPAGKHLVLFGLPAGPFKVELFNILGQRLEVATGVFAATSNWAVGPVPAAGGVYIVCVTTAGKVITRRVIVE